ncbi:uncharacterized protein LOC141662070 isoform X1 [Apium graveolens]|uniref:uncharacterized protein LOC141662070 isoform X1 n=1 Tax=Apium graveolens TaxID=4045 RepID=UPI003D7C03BF
MDDMAAYYAPPPPPPGIPQYPYYPPPLSHAPPGTVVIPPQQFHLHHQPPPPFDPYAPQLQVPQVYHDEVRTLFVAGLPSDVKSREIYNLFREFPGYESSHLRASSSNTQQPFAFAVFLDQPSAVGAMHALNGLVFDLEKNSTLYIDLAKSNSRSKRSRTDDGRSGAEKRLKGYAAFPGGNPDPAGVDSMYMPGMGNSAYNTIGYPSTQSHGSFDGGAVNYSTAAKHNTPRNATPCPTLFVASLGPTASEQELVQVFSRCPGYLKLKMQKMHGSPVAFVDFQDTASSTGALAHLQGTILYSSRPGEGMRLEYAKSRMGMRSKHSR